MGLNELLIIAVLVLAVLFFGGKKIEEISRSAGKALGTFKKGQKEAEQELKKMGKK